MEHEQNQNYMPPEHQGPRHSGKPPRKGLILSIVLGIPMIVFTLILVTCSFLDFKRDVTDDDQAVLVQAKHVKPFFPGVTVDPANEKFRKTEIVNNLDISYEYHGAGFGMMTTISVQSSPKAARSALSGSGFGMKWSMKLNGDGVSPTSCGYEVVLGAASECKFLSKGSDVVGQYISVAENRFVYTIILQGAHFETAEDAAKLLQPFLARLDGYEPSR